jgi:hypothetical protein
MRKNKWEGYMRERTENMADSGESGNGTIVWEGKNLREVRRKYR